MRLWINGNPWTYDPRKSQQQKIRELAQKAKEILAAIDSGASEEDAF